jgi:glycosyltransferase involved in cell wall biosynthesis
LYIWNFDRKAIADMTVLQLITRSEPGGGQSVVASLSEVLSARGIRVIVACGPEGGGEAWSGLSPDIERRTIDGLVRDIHPRQEFRAIRSIADAYREIKPDIIHLHTSKAAFLGRIAGAGIDGKIIYTMHGFDQLRIANQKLLWLDKALRNRCDAIVAVSESDTFEMKRHGYRPVLIRNGVRDVREMVQGDAIILERLARIKDGGLPIVMMLARDAPPKRQDLARNAAIAMEGEMSFVWIGGDPRPGDPPNFHAFGSLPNAASYLRWADIYLLLSDHEGLSIGLLEALSAGLPCIVSNIEGCREAIGLGIHVPVAEIEESYVGLAVANNERSVVAAMRMLAGNARLRSRMGLAARSRWAGQYTVGTMAESYCRLYESMTHQKAGL